VRFLRWNASQLSTRALSILFVRFVGRPVEHQVGAVVFQFSL